MRGSPLFRAGLVLLALLTLILPLRSLTARRSEQPMAAPKAAALAQVRLTITSTAFPFRFEISHLGKNIWEGESDQSSAAKDIALPFPSEGVDLLVGASWTEQKEAAVRVEVSREGRPPIAKTLWGTAHVDDVLTFSTP